MDKQKLLDWIEENKEPQNIHGMIYAFQLQRAIENGVFDTPEPPLPDTHDYGSCFTLDDDTPLPY